MFGSGSIPCPFQHLLVIAVDPVLSIPRGSIYYQNYVIFSFDTKNVRILISDLVLNFSLKERRCASKIIGINDAFTPVESRSLAVRF